MPWLGSGRTARRSHPASMFLVVLMAPVVLLVAACSLPGPATAGASTRPVTAVFTPDTPAGAAFVLWRQPSDRA
jgi:hypothetical protein